MTDSREAFRLARKLAGAGRISRRQFVQLGIAAGLTAIESEQSFAASARLQAKRGGSARFSCSGTTNDSLDPRINTSEFTQVVFYGSLSNALCESSVDGALVGDLAETFQSEQDGRKWIFKLRKGVTFHNGKDLTSDDVVASYRHHMGKDSMSGARTFVETIEHVLADGPLTVVFLLKAGNLDFPHQLSETFFPIMPSVDGAADWRSGIRSGPYILRDWRPGVYARLERNPNYHKEGRPHLDAVEFAVINDVPSRMNALIAGAVDAICSRPDLSVIDMIVRRNSRIRIAAVPGNFCFSMPMNVTVPPFDDRDVRHAIKWALQREEVAKQIFRGYASPGNDTLIAPTQKYAIDPQPVFRFDPDRARYHLRKAGLSRLKVGLSMSDAVVNGAVDAAIMLKEYASRCNIDINVVREPIDGYWDNVWMKKAWCGSNHFGSTTADREFSTASSASSPWNATKWTNGRFNELLVQARSEIDGVKRAQMYAEMQQLQHDEDGNIALVFIDFVYAYSDKLAHGKISQQGPVDDMRIAERWWAA